MLIIAQIFLLLLVGTAMGTVILRYRQSKISSLAFVLWFAVWTTGAVTILFPNITLTPARWLGLGRGTDLILYVSIIFILFLIFRIHVRLEQINREITKVVRTLALREMSFPKSKIEQGRDSSPVDPGP